MARAYRSFRALLREVMDADGILEGDAAGRYTVDFWGQHRGRAALVVRPRSTAEVAHIVKAANRLRIPLVPQGGNTGLVAGGIPDPSGEMVVLSLERMNRIREVDPAGDFLVCEAGCVLSDVQRRAEAIGRLFPLHLGAEGSCRIGGNLATNAGGIHVLRYGMMRELVLGLEVVLADGRIWDGLRALRKDNTGYDLKQLFIGSEGTLGVITAAVLRLWPRLHERVTAWLGVRDLTRAVEIVQRLREACDALLIAVEFMSGAGVELALRHLPGAAAPLARPVPWHLLVELAWPFAEGLRPKFEALLEELWSRELILDGTLADSEAARARLWRLREDHSDAARREGVIARFDVSVPPGRVPELVARVSRGIADWDPRPLPIPFGHLGDGNVHYNFVLPEGFPDQLRHALAQLVFDRVAACGGSFAAEHGIGRIKVEELARRRSSVELELFRRIKRALDPQGILNPGVILPAPRDP